MTENICDRIIAQSKSVFVCTIDEICKRMQGVVACGSKVLFLTDVGLAKAERVERALFKSYRVETVSVHEYTRAFARSVALPEDARAVVCAGDGKAAAVAKYVATRFNRPLVFVALTPDISTVQLPSSMLEEENYSEVYKTEPPVLTLLDGHMEESETRVAAGFGEVCSRLVAIFDYELSGLTGGEKTDHSVCSDALAVIKSLLFFTDKQGADTLTVARHAIALSVAAARCGNSRLFSGGDTQVAHALALLKRKSGKPAKSWGENLMTAAVPVMRAYTVFLAEVSVLPVAVPDNNVRLDLMSTALGIGPLKGAGKLSGLGTLTESLKRLHIIKEYRAELMEKCRVYEKTLGFAGKLFKRIYADKGYSFEGYLSRRELMTALYLAPEMREKITALTLMKQFGYLENLMSIPRSNN